MSWFGHDPNKGSRGGNVDHRSGGANPDDSMGLTSGGIGSAPRKFNELTNRDPNDYQGKLAGEGGLSSAFAGQSEGEFRSLGSEATAERDYLRRIASGQESVSRMQLGQALQQNQAQQQSMAAGARPGNAAMAARSAAMNAGRQGAGLAGQQAIAGIQERQAAQQSLANMLMQQRQQELQGALGARANASGSFSGALNSAMGTPTGLEKGFGFATDAAAATVPFLPKKK